MASLPRSRPAAYVHPLTYIPACTGAAACMLTILASLPRSDMPACLPAVLTMAHLNWSGLLLLLSLALVVTRPVSVTGELPCVDGRSEILYWLHIYWLHSAQRDLLRLDSSALLYLSAHICC